MHCVYAMLLRCNKVSARARYAGMDSHGACSPIRSGTEGSSSGAGGGGGPAAIRGQLHASPTGEVLSAATSATLGTPALAPTQPSGLPVATQPAPAERSAQATKPPLCTRRGESNPALAFNGDAGTAGCSAQQLGEGVAMAAAEPMCVAEGGNPVEDMNRATQLQAKGNSDTTTSGGVVEMTAVAAVDGAGGADAALINPQLNHDEAELDLEADRVALAHQLAQFTPEVCATSQFIGTIPNPTGASMRTKKGLAPQHAANASTMHSIMCACLRQNALAPGHSSRAAGLAVCAPGATTAGGIARRGLLRLRTQSNVSVTHEHATCFVHCM
jgi:hypothetical protein